MNARPIHRYLSFMIDLAFTGGVSFLVGYPSLLALWATLSARSYGNIVNLFSIAMVTGAIVTITSISYYLVLPLVWKKQTIGRFVTRIAIVKEDGMPVDFQTLFVREVIGRLLGGFMSLGLSIFVEGALIARSDRHSFSDHLARTRVVDI